MSSRRVPPRGLDCKGIDISHHQVSADFDVLDDVNDFCFHKATEGVTVTDKKFKSRWAALKNKGMLRGAYHFFRPKSHPLTQAEHFLSVVGPLDKWDLPLVLDMEVVDGVALKTIVEGARLFLEHIEEETGKRPIIYSYSSFLNDLPDLEKLAKYPLWIADYGSDNGAKNKPPNVPSQWETWTFWQYTSKSKEKGTPKPIDANVFNGAYFELLAFVNDGTLPGTVTQAPPIPSPLPPEPTTALDKRQETFIEMARAEGYLNPATYLINVMERDNSKSNPRYYFIFDVGVPDTKKRFLLFDTEAKIIERRFGAHGIGSDQNNDDMADKFSNVVGSKCTSLGVCKTGKQRSCARHRREVPLIGLEPTNDNMVKRLILIHPAKNYVVEAKGICGRTEGCIGIDDKYAQAVMDKLEGGSYGIIYAKGKM